MTIRRSTVLATAGALVLSLVGATAAVQSVSAVTTTPSYYPDAASIGTVTLYDASGTPISSGSVNDSPLATYYKASGPRTGSFATNSGFVTYYTPQDGINPQLWTSGEQWTSGQNYTTAQAAYPAGLNDPASNVVIKGSATDGGLQVHIDSFTSTSANDPGIYQIRLKTSAEAVTYYTADIKVTGSTWSLVYPAAATVDATSTTLVTSPSGSGDSSTDLTLTATVSDSTTPGTVPTGSVTFKDGASTVQSGVTLNGSGQASVTLAKNTVAFGSHSFTAEYTPGGNFTESVSSAVAYSVSLPLPAVVIGAGAGAARVGVAATCNPGTWTYAGDYSYAWYRDADVTPFAATRTTAVLPASYYAHKVRCVVTAINPSGSATSTSAQATVAAGAASVIKTRPKIVGTLLVGRKLAAYRGIWSPAPSSYLYVWKRGSTVVSKAATYTTTKYDKGKLLVLYVYAVRAGYLTGVAASRAVKIG